MMTIAVGGSCGYTSSIMRTANEVINQAIAENRKPEWLLYGFATIFVLTGEVLIGWSLYVKAPISGIAGVVLNGLAWPAFRETKRLRAENLMLRMLEIPLSKTHTAQEAAKMLTEAFAQHFQNRVPTSDATVPNVSRGEKR
jgi:hypothetical protein